MMHTQKRNKHFLIIIGVATAMILSGFTLSFAGENPEFVKIGLKYITAAPSTCVITEKEDLAIWNFQEDENFFVLNGIQEISISVEDGVLCVAGPDDEVVTCVINGTPQKVSDLITNGYGLVPGNYLDYLHSENKEFDAIIYYDGKAYRGGMCFYINANNTFNVINQLSIDEYTYGVINGEMGYSNPMEALKAQAVVARSYALTNSGKHKASGYDLCDSTHCQVYKGYSDENIKTNQAVDETRDLSIYYENLPVAAFFSKNSGGFTQNVEDVWNSKLGYLRGVKDIYSPVYNWNVAFTFAEIESKLRVAGYQVGNLESIAITGRNSSGAVAEVEFIGDAGKADIAKEKIRTILGMTSVKSTMFNISADTGIVSRGVYVRGAGTSSLTEEKVYVLDGSGNTVELDQKNAFVLDGNSSCRLFENSSDGSQVTGETVTFTGTGSGHGIGMPQDSAIEMAKQGFTFREILDFFYTDIEIK